jgi:hypothetical protein
MMDAEFIKVNIKDRSDKELDLIIQSEKFLGLLACMIREIQLNEINEIKSQIVNPSTLDISEKLQLNNRKNMSRFWFTIFNLRKVALEERTRREKTKKKE